MKLRTEIQVPTSDFKISHEDPILMLGSCFTQNIGSKLSNAAFDVSLNPLGISYNPISISKALINSLNDIKISPEELVFNNDKWHSLDHHSDFSFATKEEVVEKINKGISETKNSLGRAKHLMISLGTAWIFEKDGTVVNNCHKLNNNAFTKRIIGAKEITKSFMQLKELLDPKLKIVLTVSPIRHQKDGLIENSRSKSTLIYAAQYLANNVEGFFYFPSYEIMVDDLRDYRFYEKDLLHPNELAIEYLWNKFSAAYMNKETLGIAKEVEKLRKAENHKIFDPETSTSKAHLEYISKLKNQLQTDYPNLKL